MTSTSRASVDVGFLGSSPRLVLSSKPRLAACGRRRCIVRTRVRSQGEGPEERTVGSLIRKAFLTEVEVPLVFERRTVKSGYILATVLSAVFGNGGVAACFVLYFALATFVDAPAFLAAVASGVTSLLFELLRVNVSSVAGVKADSSDFVVGLLVFGITLGVLYGVDPNASVALPDVNGADIDDSRNESAPRRSREVLSREEQQEKKALQGSEEGDFGEQIKQDLRQWDEKFIDRNTAFKDK
eukprot:Plantae.Rhodophyta-Purpureofilum_apyrenoidigerum.ctg4372.p1 GENE.Plantae.Rhodophyta-Purpureofilum_apyrenoidigerum.ctg4372~~Plantae.Rhodophyta-Purpureofilum_apyrenoidigerum.ctg4372.p1  ORF type:complete len:242 (+),score=44.16 Plantae.Rhodophyta-Purpureofilum_apyrenoidigerum.ctg4372:254-979(+)